MIENFSKIAKPYFHTFVGAEGVVVSGPIISCQQKLLRGSRESEMQRRVNAVTNRDLTHAERHFLQPYPVLCAKHQVDEREVYKSLYG